jgi:hypothetical protein
METYEPIFTQVDVAGEVIDCPKTEHEWLYPDDYVGKNIIWFMANHICLNDFVSTETINRFFQVPGSWQLLNQILPTANGHQYLNIIDNAREHVTDLDLQETLIRIILQKHNSGLYDIFVKMTKDLHLKTVRHNIWNFLK